jgi:hypothetical protein
MRALYHNLHSLLFEMQIFSESMKCRKRGVKSCEFSFEASSYRLKGKASLPANYPTQNKQNLIISARIEANAAIHTVAHSFHFSPTRQAQPLVARGWFVICLCWKGE